MQVSNKYVALDLEEGEVQENNQLIWVEDDTIIRSPRPSPTSTGKLNQAVAVFNANSIGFKAAKEGLTTSPKGNGVKESTAQWVNKAFGDYNIATNQSCQEILSQSLDINVIPEQENLKDHLNFSGGKLWSEQVEEESDEGEFFEGHEYVEEVEDDDQEQEEKNVNGKSG